MQRYPPVPLPILKGFLTIFHGISLLALGVAFVLTIISARSDWSWQDTVVCVALVSQALIYIGLFIIYHPFPWPRWLMPVYFISVLLLWLVEIWLSPGLFWLGFTFIGQMFGVLPLLPALVGAVLVFAVMFFRGPLGSISAAPPLEQFSWAVSWISMLILLSYLSHLSRTSRERAHLIDQLRRAQEELEAARKKEAELAVLRERERLARDLHDTLGHNLVALSVQLEAAQRLYPVNPEAASAVLDDLKRLTRGSMDELRRTLSGMRSPGLGGRPLKEALEDLCTDFGRRNRLKVDFAWGAEIPDLSEPVAEVLWRAAQEALTNVEKHASDASRVLVRLLPSSREICLLVEDDGRGFNPQPDGQGHYGLAGMGERVQGVGGRLTIDSSPGKGTRLEVYIPT